MKLLYLCEDGPLDPERPASGNQIRAARLARSLEAAGVEVKHAWRNGPDGFQRAGDIERLIRQQAPDVILLGYWKLLEWLQEPPAVPVVVDCYAPRPLEQLLADPATADLYLQRYLAALRGADLILVGNARQRRLLAAWLLSDGVDVRAGGPVIELVHALTPVAARVRAPARPLVAVSGGQSWAWREASAWLKQLAGAELAGRVELHCFGAAEDAVRMVDQVGDQAVDQSNNWPSGLPGVRHPLLSWTAWQDFLLEQADLGLELSEHNLEREHCQPFRVLDYLAAGLPLLVNPWLPLAPEIERYDAGWVVETPAEALRILSELAERPEQLARKSSGALRLARERFAPDAAVAPLLHWLQAPHKRARIEDRPAGTPAPGTLAAPKPSLGGQLARALLRPFARRVEGRGVVVVTRHDLFPTDHGAAVKIVETARALSRLGRPVAVVTAERGRWWELVDGRFEARRLPAWLRWTAPPRALAHLLHQARGLPASNAFLYWPLNDPWYGLRAAWAGRHIGAGTVLAEFPGYAQAARLARVLNGSHAVMAEHNVEYERLAEQLPDLSASQYRKLKQIELHLAGCMDAVVCVSDADRRRLIADGLDPASVSLIPHGVDLAGMTPGPEAAGPEHFGLDPKRPILVFHGTFSYPPNRQALSILAEELLPRLAAAGQHCQLLAIGSRPPAAVDHPDIVLTGSLPSLAGALGLATVAVVPLISGGGTRMKILDYFAAGVPVVSTAKGCEGLPLSDGVELLIRDDWDGFAASVLELIESAQQRRELAARARAMVERLDWLEIGKRYDALLNRLG